MADFYTIITDAGQVLLAEAMASGVPVVLTQFAVGDGGGQPITLSPSMTTLVNEVYRGPITNLSTSPAQPDALVAQLIVPSDSGGYTVREVGLFTGDGTLFSVANYPDQLKPPIDSGYAVTLDLSYILVVSDTSAITVIIQPGDYLTQEQADDRYLNTDLNLQEIADAGETAQAESRAHLGLNTAATHPVQVHPTDNISGAVLMNGSWGLGGIAVHLTDGHLVSPQGHETVLFVQGGGSGDAHFGSFGAGLHLKYGSDATVTHSANLYITAAGRFKVEWMMVDIATGAVTTFMQELYGTLNPPPPPDLTNYYTKAESDARYGTGITGFRMANYGATYGNLRDSSTTIMTGIYEDNGYDNPTTHEHRQAQFEVAGAWYNVAYV